MTGLSVLSLSAVGMLVDIRRGGAAPSPADYAAAVLFFGRIPLGPAGYGERVLRSLQAPRPSLSGIGRGVMLLISGVAKQVAISGEFIALFRTLSTWTPTKSRWPPAGFMPSAVSSGFTSCSPASATSLRASG